MKKCHICGMNLKKNYKTKCTKCHELVCYLCIKDHINIVCNKCDPDIEDLPDGAYWALRSELK